MPYVENESMVLGGNTPLPLDRYIVEIIKSEVATSKKENAKPTLRVQCEVIHPTTVEVEGQQYASAGRRVFMMPNSIDPSENWGLGRIRQGLERSDFDFTKFHPSGKGIDTDKFHVLVGHRMAMKFGTVEEFQTRPAQFGETGEVLVDKVPHVYILNTKGERLSKGHKVVNEKGVSPGWDEVIGDGNMDGEF